MTLRTKIYVGLIGLALAVCGDDKLYRYDAPPLPETSAPAPQPSDRQISTPTPLNHPQMSVNSTLKDCLGFFGKSAERLRALCPEDRSTGECPESYSNFVTAAETLGTQLAERLQSEVSLIDILNGGGSLEATALAHYRQQNNVLLGEQNEVIAEGPSYHADLLVVPGNHLEQVQRYLEEGNLSDVRDFSGNAIYFSNFPLEHLSCNFDDWREMSAGAIRYARHAAYWRNPEQGTEIQVNANHLLDEEGETKLVSVHGILSTESVGGPYETANFNITALEDNIQDSIANGQQTVRDLAFGADPYHSEWGAQGVMYWPNAIEWELE